LRAIANLRVIAIVEAFARVPREGFLGPAPWQIGHAQPLDPAVPYRATPDAGLADIHQDVVVEVRTGLIGPPHCAAAME
jgi:hypothetical protein